MGQSPGAWARVTACSGLEDPEDYQILSHPGWFCQQRWLQVGGGLARTAPCRRCWFLIQLPTAQWGSGCQHLHRWSLCQAQVLLGLRPEVCVGPGEAEHHPLSTGLPISFRPRGGRARGHLSQGRFPHSPILGAAGGVSARLHSLHNWGLRHPCPQLRALDSFLLGGMGGAA